VRAGGHRDRRIKHKIDTDYLPPDYNIKSGLREVVFLNQEGPNSYADGDAVYDGVCDVCHTGTKYHRRAKLS